MTTKDRAVAALRGLVSGQPVDLSEPPPADTGEPPEPDAEAWRALGKATAAEALRTRTQRGF